MVDCPTYEKQELTKQQIFWSKFFKKSINQKGELSFELYVDRELKKGSELTLGRTIDDLINPDYEFYETVKKLIMTYEEVRGGSSALASQSSHYQNSLHILAAIYDCANHQELEIWEAKFNKKFTNNNVQKNI